MDISTEIPLHALAQEDTLSLWLKLLPMKECSKGRAPSFLRSLFPYMFRPEGITHSNNVFKILRWGWGQSCSFAWAYFPMFPAANENTGKWHAPIS